MIRDRPQNSHGISPGDAPATAAAPRHRGRIYVLDGIRLLAALMVALYHFVAFEGSLGRIWGVSGADIFPGLYNVASYGWLGVQLFFLISGFVICMSCWGRTPADFFRSRVTRLFPAYWPAVLITASVIWLFPIVLERPKPSDVLVNLTMLQAPLGVRDIDGSYWTLWCEAAFYLLFAVVVWRGLNRRRALLFCYAWMIVTVCYYGAGSPAVLDMTLQPLYSAFFVAGIAFYLMYRFGPSINLWGVIFVAYAIAQHNTIERVRDVAKLSVHHPLMPVIGVLLVTIYFAVLAVIALGWLNRIQWKWLTTAGALTYPFYLLHESIGWTIINQARDLAPSYVVLVAVLLLMLLAAWLLHRFIEKPLAKYLKTRMTPVPEDPPPPPAKSDPPPISASEAVTAILPVIPRPGR